MIACAIVRSLTMRRLTKTFCGPRVGPCIAPAPRCSRAIVRPAGVLPDLDQVGAFAEQLKEALAQSGCRRALEQARPPLVSEKPTSG